MEQESAVGWLVKEANLLENNGWILPLFEQAKEMEKQQKIAYKISTPLGHVAHCIEQYGIENAIEEYRCKSVNNKESKFWNDCLKIAEFSYNL
jgi:hypothetical protein